MIRTSDDGLEHEQLTTDAMTGTPVPADRTARATIYFLYLCTRKLFDREDPSLLQAVSRI